VFLLDSDWASGSGGLPRLQTRRKAAAIKNNDHSIRGFILILVAAIIASTTSTTTVFIFNLPVNDSTSINLHFNTSKIGINQTYPYPHTHTHTHTHFNNILTIKMAEETGMKDPNQNQLEPTGIN